MHVCMFKKLRNRLPCFIKRLRNQNNVFIRFVLHRYQKNVVILEGSNCFSYYQNLFACQLHFLKQ